jgi:hypothetical protein
MNTNLGTIFEPRGFGAAQMSIFQPNAVYTMPIVVQSELQRRAHILNDREFADTVCTN